MIVAKWHVRRTSGAPKALVVALSFCRLLGLGCPKQAFAKIATPRLFLEAGMTRSKNAANIAMKNVTDTVVTVLGFWICGFAIMFGIGQEGKLSDLFFVPIGKNSSPWLTTFFMFQTFFCATTATIISGAIAERVRFVSYPIITAFVIIIIYPIFGQWTWGSAFLGTPGWLEKAGFIDFAGSTVVHSTAGWISLSFAASHGERTRGLVVPRRRRAVVLSESER